MDTELKLLFRYIKNLGFYQGLSIFLKVEFFKSGKFKLDQYPDFFYLRPFTSDIKVFREIFLFRVYSFELNFIPAVIIDAGANIGLSSIFFAGRFPLATIYAIEPETSNFFSLQKNIAGYRNIKAAQTALWHRDTMLKIVDPKENHWAFTVEECDKGDPGSFCAVSITSFMQHHGIEKIDLLKMDIEGAEREVFSANYDYWLIRTKMIIIELHDWLKAGCSSVFFNAIARYNIKTTVHEGMLLIEINP
ncbi:MAG: FkbM family methyltransferase [Cyclobacteriaceae bacterium]